MRRLLLLAAACAAVACTPGSSRRAVSPETPAQAAVSEPTIDRERMVAVLRHLSSDELRGRYTLAPEDIDRAAGFLADAYREAGIAPVGADYRVAYDVVAGSRPAQDLNVWLETGADPHAFTEREAVAIANGGGAPVFAALTQMAAKGKADRVAGSVALVTTATADAAEVTAQVERAVGSGARAVLLLVDELPDPVPLRAALEAANNDAPVALVTRDALGGRVDLAADGRTYDLDHVRVSMAAKLEDIKRKAPNVLAYMPGQDLADEIVLVGAHFDHIGTSERGHFCRTRTREDGSIDDVCNGADDNGSGTAGLLELARSLAAAGYRPRRSLVFAHFSGEELGLYGSQALAESPPAVAPFVDGKVVAMINMDMIGRLGAAGLSIGGLSSSDGWRPLLDDAGDHGLEIIYERAVTSRSDHAHWYRRKIPVLFFFTGLHEDYHGPGDEFDRINVDGMADILAIVTSVTMAAASGAKLRWADPRSAAEGEVGRLPGSDPKTVEAPTG